MIHPRLFCRELDISHAFAPACDCFSLAAAPRAKTDPNRRSRRQSFLGPPLTIIATSTNTLPKIPRHSSSAKTRPPLHQALVDTCYRLCPDDTGLAPQCPPVPCIFYRIPLPLPPRLPISKWSQFLKQSAWRSSVLPLRQLLFPSLHHPLPLQWFHRCDCRTPTTSLT